MDGVILPPEQKSFFLRNAIFIAIFLFTTAAVSVPKLSRVSVDVDYSDLLPRSGAQLPVLATQLRGASLVDTHSEDVNVLGSFEDKNPSAAMHLRGGGVSQDVVDSYEASKNLGFRSDEATRPSSLRGGGSESSELG
eukprot:3185795-Rhodomonas_salina.1